MGTPIPVSTTTPYTGGTGGPDFIIGSGSANLSITGGGGEDVIIGNAGVDTITVLSSNFAYVDGGTGAGDVLNLSSATPQMWDFTNGSLGGVNNIANLYLAVPGSAITLDNQSVSDIAGSSNSYTLSVDAAQGSVIINNALGTTDLYNVSNTGNSLDFFGSYGGHGVNLLVDPEASAGGDFSAGTLGVATRITSGTTGNEAGDSVAVSGNYIAVGTQGSSSAESVYVVNLANSTSPQITVMDPGASSVDNFGNSVAISGNTLVVGADGTTQSSNTHSGAVYVYGIDNGTATLEDTFVTNPTPAANAWFGNSVAVSGNLVVAGAYNATTNGDSLAGQAYVYDLATGNTLALNTSGTAAAGADYGWSVAASGDTSWSAPSAVTAMFTNTSITRRVILTLWCEPSPIPQQLQATSLAAVWRSTVTSLSSARHMRLTAHREAA